MNRRNLFLFFCFLSFVLQSQTKIRENKLFNADWLFLQGNTQSNFQNTVQSHFQLWVDESKWEKVNLPHDPAVAGNFSREHSGGNQGFLPFGNGWYRKHFFVEQGLKDKKIFIDFEGVYRNAEVYINGVFLGKQLNGYLGFRYDLSKYINYGQDNVIAVRYDNSNKTTSRWYTGEGIYRNVHLITTSKLYIPQYGIFITTPTVNEKHSSVKIETEVLNDFENRQTVKLLSEIHDLNGNKVGEFTSIAPLNPGETFTFIQEIDIDNPKLWSCETPSLYKVVSKVYTDKQCLDDAETKFGIREIRMTPEKGLLLNGEKIIAKGGNMHHDLGCLGAAALEKGYERKLKLLKEMGCNSVRLSHNPHAPVLLDVADRLGILVFNEVYDKWNSQYYGEEVPFEQCWRADLESFVKRDRNHPCVYIWSMGNEVLQQQGIHDIKFETPQAAADYGVELFKNMKEFTHHLDPTRKITVGLFPAREKFVCEWHHWDNYDYFTQTNPAEMAFYSDVVSWNYTENMFIPDQKSFPQMMFIASESSTNLDFGNRKNSWLELDLERIIGYYYWTATDYLGESIWPSKVWGRAFLDITDKMTPIGYLYQSFYNTKPMVRVMVCEKEGKEKEWFDNMANKRWNWYPMAEHWNWEDNEMLQLQIFSNTEEVELLLNGKSLGKKKGDKKRTHIDWEIPYQKGKLKVIGRNKGKIVAEHTLKTAGDPVAIQLEPNTKTLEANGLDLAYIRVSLIDKDGIVVPKADRLIQFDIKGEGILGGVANSDIFSDEPWVGLQKTTYRGECLLVVRSTNNKGNVIIKALVEDLPPQTLNLQCK